MAYWGYIGLIKGYLSGFTEEYYPKILEIGVDKKVAWDPTSGRAWRDVRNGFRIEYMVKEKFLYMLFCVFF